MNCASGKSQIQTVISYYPLPDRLKEKIDAEYAGKCHYVPVGWLRNLGIRQALREVRNLRSNHMLIGIGEETAWPFAGPLLLLAAISGSKHIRLARPDGSITNASRLRLLRVIFQIGVDQIASRIALRLAAGEASRMAAAPLIKPHTNRSTAVLYLDANLSFGLAAGGSLGHIRGVIDALVRRAYEVDYASVKPIPTDLKGSLWEKIQAPNLYCFPPELNYYAFARTFENRAASLVQKKNYAFLYQRMSLHNFSGARLRKRLKLPLVLEYNGSEAWTAANWGQKLQLHDMAILSELAALRQADLIVTVSEVLGQEVANAGVPAERIVVYPNCIDPSIFNPDRFSRAEIEALRRRYAIDGDAKVATFIGTFGTWHGVDFLARAIRQLINDDPSFVRSNKLHFLLIGDGLKMAEVRQALDHEPYSEFVTLTGLVPQSNAPIHLAASDIFLSPHVPTPDGSDFFGSPTKLFEYMAMAKPIVASDLNQIGAVLRHAFMRNTDKLGEPLAILFTPGDEQAFLSALRSVITDPQRAQGMANRARQAALEFYTWDRHVDAILGRLSELGLLSACLP